METREFQTLIGKYMDGICDEADLEELVREVEASDDAALTLARHLYHEDTIARILQGDRAVAAGSRKISARSKAADTPPGWFTTRQWISIAAVLFISVGAYFTNEWQASRVPELLHARVTEASGDARIFRNDVWIPVDAGMELYEQDIVDIRDKGKILIGYENEDTRIRMFRSTRIEFPDAEGGKRIRHKWGRIDCDVAPQPENRHMKMLTDQAVADIIGTRFKLSAMQKLNVTRLDVQEGLVRLTRLMDQKQVDVAGGQYVVVAIEFHDLVVKEFKGTAVPDVFRDNSPASRTHLDGKILFEDDFSDSSFSNWEVIQGTPATGFTAMTGNPGRFLKSGEKTLRDGTDVSLLHFSLHPDDATDPDMYFGIRLKRSISAERFVIEAHMSWLGTSHDNEWGLETAGDVRIVEEPPISFYPITPQVYRWEFMPAEDAARDGLYFCTLSMWTGESRRFLQSFYCSSKSGKILIACPRSKQFMMCPERFEMYRVTVRELN